MDLTLSRRGDYCVRAMVYLARAWEEDGGGYRKIREVAETMDLPRSYTPHILGTLARAGLAEARAGRGGGYRLTRPPERISLLEVVEGGEGDLRPDRCPLRGGPCHWDQACALHPAWSRAADAIRESLRRTALSEVTAADRLLERGALEGFPAPHRRPRTADARTRGR